jgi:RNA polymerase sigma-70 factor (ECF subfamily)
VTTDRDWLAALRGPDQAVRMQAGADLRDFLRRTLAKGFGRQLADADLDDLTQESLLRVHRHLDSFAEQSRFTTWAAAIAVNQALSQLRRRRYEHVSLDEAIEQADLSGDDDESEADVALLRQGIAEALTDRQRVAIQAALGGMPLMELARREGVSQGAVYKLLHDARRRLRSFLEMKVNRAVGSLQEVES